MGQAFIDLQIKQASIIIIISTIVSIISSLCICICMCIYVYIYIYIYVHMLILLLYCYVLSLSIYIYIYTGEEGPLPDRGPPRREGSGEGPGGPILYYTKL